MKPADWLALCAITLAAIPVVALAVIAFGIR